MRVLRALDEEGQRQRANSLVIHAPVEVAMYTLNQKRREIARMEQDYAITIAFQPKDEMQAGTFDMERIGQRAPEERAKTAPPILDTPLIAVQVEEEIDSAVEEEEEQDVVEGEVETTQASQPEAQPNGENGGRRRRRRRRRGRDRNQQPGQPNSAPANLQQSETHEASEADGEGDDEEDDHDHAEGQNGEHHEQPQGAAPNGEGGRKRRRRRRRGRRGGQREGGNPNYVGSGDGEGAPIDASLQNGDGPVIGGDASDTSVISPAPNAPSAPVWSLSAETHQEPREEPIARVDINIPPDVANEFVDAASAITAEAVRAQIAEPAAPHADEPQAPSRKGWWQRPFRSRE